MDTAGRVATNGVTVVTLAGELDVLEADCLRQRLTTLVEGGCSHLVVDLAQVAFLDSTVLGVLLGAHKRITERRGRLALVVEEEAVLKVLRVSALMQVLTICRTLEEALASV